MHATALGGWLVAADLAREHPGGQRTPDNGSNLLVKGKRHELPFVLTSDQGVKSLVGDIPCPAIGLRSSKGLHQVPARKIGTGDVADLAALDQRIEGTQRLLNRGERIEAMQRVDIDMIGIQPAQTLLTCPDQMIAGGTKLVLPTAYAECCLLGDQELISPPVNRLAKNLF